MSFLSREKILIQSTKIVLPVMIPVIIADPSDRNFLCDWEGKRRNSEAGWPPNHLGFTAVNRVV